jgi:hypothetical protein
MTEEQFNTARDRAIASKDDARLAELEQYKAEGRVGVGNSVPSTADEAFSREVERASRSGDTERLAELERMAAEDRREEAWRSSTDLRTKLAGIAAEHRERGDSDLANQLDSIRTDDNPAEALQNALRSATGERYDTLQTIA